MVYTVRLAGGRGGTQHLRDTSCAASTWSRRTPAPNHPTTCGKVERFQQTMKKWLRAQPAQPTTIAELQALLDPSSTSTTTAGHTGPCRTEPRRPARYTTLPKALPGESRDPDTHDRIRHDRVDKAGSSPCATTAGCTTSASAEPTPEPTSSCSSRTSTSASSTPSPANSSAN